MKNEGLAAVQAAPGVRPQARLRLAQVGVLAFFLFALPLVEAPKNIAAVLFVAVWALDAWRAGDVGGRWNRYDTAFALMLGTGLLSGLSAYAGDLGGVFRVFLLAWVVSRARLDERDFRVLAGSACAGLLLAIPMAAVPMFQGTRQFFELPSVGQVNQSALYLAILAAAAFGWWFQLARSSETGRERTGLAVSATVFWAALLVTASRAAILAALLAVACTAACAGWQARDGKLRRVFTRAVATMGALVVLVAGLATWSPSLSDHKLAPDRLVTTYSMQNRMQHWRIAYEGWLQRPLLGWGPDGFQHLKVEEVCAWRHERGEICNPAQYVETKHAHSLYMATLAERGIVGMAALAFLVALWAWSLACTARSAASSSWWAASAVGLAVVVVGGLFNTTLRVEHGSLAAVFFGLWIAAHGRGSRPASRSA